MRPQDCALRAGTRSPSCPLHPLPTPPAGSFLASWPEGRSEAVSLQHPGREIGSLPSERRQDTRKRLSERFPRQWRWRGEDIGEGSSFLSVALSKATAAAHFQTCLFPNPHETGSAAEPLQGSKLFLARPLPSSAGEVQCAPMAPSQRATPELLVKTAQVTTPKKPLGGWVWSPGASRPQSWPATANRQGRLQTGQADANEIQEAEKPGAAY